MEPPPEFRISVDAAVAQRFPDYAALVIHAHGLTNGPGNDSSERALRAAEGAQRVAFADRRPGDHPHLAAWRNAYRSFGLKPSRYLNSAESLLSRVLKGEGLPRINRLVDVYNSASVAHVIPLGGEDLDRVVGAPTLRLARGDEPFDTTRDGQSVIDHPEPGEVVWVDDRGVTCRGWNWRQGLRTRLTEATRHAYFILDRLEPYPLEDLHAAGEDLARLIRQVSPGCTLETQLLGARTGRLSAPRPPHG